MLDDLRLERAYRDAGAARWDVPKAELAAALARGIEKAYAGRQASAADIDGHLARLHLPDLALACACALGREAAWDHFVAEYRPVLRRAADAVAPDGGAREAADALLAELYGVRGGEARRSLFTWFHGRSSLATWLRTLVAQRYVDRVREVRRADPLPDDVSPVPLRSREAPPDPDRARFAGAMREALGRAILALDARDRLRLGCYYAREMTLAAIGRLTREHEATVSRHLARTRRLVREAVEGRLRQHHGFGEREVAECFASLAADPGALDLGDWLGDGPARKKPAPARSMSEDLP